MNSTIVSCSVSSSLASSAIALRYLNKAKATALWMLVLTVLAPISTEAQQPQFSIDDLDVQAVQAEHHQDWGKAQQVRTEILRRMEALFKADDIRLIKPLNDVVRDNCIDGKCSEALPYLQQLLKIRLVRFGPSNMEVANTYLLLGEDYEKMHDYDRACSFFRQAAQMHAILTAADSNDTIGNRLNIIRALKEKEDYAGEKKEIEDCLALIARKKSADPRLKAAILDYQKELGSKHLR